MFLGCIASKTYGSFGCAIALPQNPFRKAYIYMDNHILPIPPGKGRLGWGRRYKNLCRGPEFQLFMN